jgi:hypothetical protein
VKVVWLIWMRWVSNSRSNFMIKIGTPMKKLMALLCVLGLLLPTTIGCGDKVEQPEKIEEAPPDDPGDQTQEMEAPK